MFGLINVLSMLVIYANLGILATIFALNLGEISFFILQHKIPIKYFTDYAEYLLD